MKTTFLPFIFFIAMLFQGIQSATSQNVAPSFAMQEIDDSVDFTTYISGQELIVEFDYVQQKEVVVELYDITGKKLVKKTLPKSDEKQRIIQLNQTINKGLYIVKVTADGKEIAQKVQT